jgi:hypothetical protein
MQCLSCGADTDKIELFLKVALCGECAQKAKRLKDRARSELETMLVAMDDIMRHALVSSGLELDRVDSLTGEEIVTYIFAMNKHFRKEQVHVDGR